MLNDASVASAGSYIRTCRRIRNSKKISTIRDFHQNICVNSTRIYGIWGNFVKIWYFVNNCLIQVWIWKFFCPCVIHIIVVTCSTAHFISTKSIFRYIQISLPNFAFFTIKSPSITQWSVSQVNAFKKSKNPSPLFRRTIGLNNCFTLIENNLWFLR